MNEIDLSDISRYRKPLMGMAILFVMLFHIPMHHWCLMYPVSNIGNYGVDIFLFLSGIGLWYSWENNNSLKRFFHRRFWRVYPEYFIVACVLYIWDFSNACPRYNDNIAEVVGSILFNLCFWNGKSNSLWFIPAIMTLYIFAPGYMNLIKRNPAYRWLPVLFIVLAFLLQYNNTLHDSLKHLEIFTSRLPIFFIGLNCGQMVKEGKKLKAGSWLPILLVFILSFIVATTFTGYHHPTYPKFLLRMTYIPLTITSIILMCQLFRHTSKYIMSVISFIGGLSLECYLVHEHFIMYPMFNAYHTEYYETAFITIPLAVMLAWLLHRICHFTIRINFRKKK
jgi:peptidoglycan/LPS O-acetylase OafA/YrhL